jgi:hypothetical protein
MIAEEQFIHTIRRTNHGTIASWAQRICFTTEDHRASVQAFMNKQPTPKYQGK